MLVNATLPELQKSWKRWAVEWNGCICTCMTTSSVIESTVSVFFKQWRQMLRGWFNGETLVSYNATQNKTKQSMQLGLCSVVIQPYTVAIFDPATQDCFCMCHCMSLVARYPYPIVSGYVTVEMAQCKYCAPYFSFSLFRTYIQLRSIIKSGY